MSYKIGPYGRYCLFKKVITRVFFKHRILFEFKVLALCVVYS